VKITAFVEVKIDASPQDDRARDNGALQIRRRIPAAEMLQTALGA
jgi:hypothetical protein